MRRKPSPRAEHREELAHRADGAEHVDVRAPTPVLLGELVDRAELLDADVGAEDVAAAERRRDVLGGLGHRSGVADVGSPADVVGTPCRSVIAAAVDCAAASAMSSTATPAPAPAKACGHRCAQSCSATGDHRDLAGEIGDHVVVFRRFIIASWPSCTHGRSAGTSSLIGASWYSFAHARRRRSVVLGRAPWIVRG